MSSRHNMRQFTRVAIAIEAEVMALENGKRVIRGRTKDLSMKGVYVVCGENLPVGTDCHVSLFPSGEPKHFYIEANSRVIRVTESGMGIEFVEIIGLGSYEHLRNIVLYNSCQETEQVEEEFKRHLGIKKRE